MGIQVCGILPVAAYIATQCTVVRVGVMFSAWRPLAQMIAPFSGTVNRQNSHPNCAIAPAINRYTLP